ncbi:MAG: Na+/H+ antiporter NhaC family protein [Bacteroidales bacterium]|nr:Na+/H+ antiporter NhaC family protein [Bacteroidales bacterium]
MKLKRVKKIVISFCCCICCVLSAFSQQQSLTMELPAIIVTDIQMPIIIRGDSIGSQSVVSINGQNVHYQFTDSDSNSIVVHHCFQGNETIAVSINNETITAMVTPIPLWFSILPPLIAIVLAFLIKEVFVSLFVGILTGTTIISFYADNDFFSAILLGIIRFIDTYVLNSVLEVEHLSIIIFSILIGGMVQIISSNGGMRGLIDLLSKRAKTAQSGQLIVWILGILVFFDDYANTLVIGNTMRPVTDRLKISREKLSYIVDSTAAPVATIAFITTWIGAQLTYIQEGLDVIGLDLSPYSVFVSSLQYAFYPFLTLIFIVLLIIMQRDFGPMLKAERRARVNALVETEKDVSMKKKGGLWLNAVLPIGIMIFGTIIGLYFTGKQAVGWNDELAFSRNISQIMGAANSYQALLWASLGALLTAVVMSLFTRQLSLKNCMDKMIDGFKLMLPAVVILILAWTMANITKSLYTADFFSILFIHLHIHYAVVPALTFVFAFIIAFSTGTSWGTMAILYPLILPTSWMICQNSGVDTPETMQIFYNVTAAVLSGAVFGDHCSPISDTTILSSLSCSCHHLDHVRTQMPYAMTVGFVSLLFGTLLSALGVSLWIIFPLCILLLTTIVRFVGKRI